MLFIKAKCKIQCIAFIQSKFVYRCMMWLFLSIKKWIFLFPFCFFSYNWSSIMKGLGVLILELPAHLKCDFICSLYHIFFSLFLLACLELFSTVRSNNIVLWKKKIIFVFTVIIENGQNLLTNTGLNCGICERTSLTVTF